MPDEALTKRVREIFALQKAGKTNEAFAAYGELFESGEFQTYHPEDQRSAIRLVVNAKVAPNRPPPAMVAAHKSAIVPLDILLAGENDPQDYELLGICYVLLDNEKKAAELFRAGLTLERARNPQSNLCGSLMKWMAAV